MTDVSMSIRSIGGKHDCFHSSYGQIARSSRFEASVDEPACLIEETRATN